MPVAKAGGGQQRKAANPERPCPSFRKPFAVKPIIVVIVVELIENSRNNDGSNNTVLVIIVVLSSLLRFFEWFVLSEDFSICPGDSVCQLCALLGQGVHAISRSGTWFACGAL